MCILTSHPFIHHSEKKNKEKRKKLYFIYQPCLHLNTPTKQKHLSRSNNVSSQGWERPHPPSAKAQFCSSTPPVALGHHHTKVYQWLLPKHLLLLHTAGDGICCSYLKQCKSFFFLCIVAATDQVVMMNCLSTAINHAHMHTNTQM